MEVLNFPFQAITASSVVNSCNKNPLIYWLSPSSIPEISGEPAAVCPEVANPAYNFAKFCL
jgi:hypothetical protein